MAFVGAEEFRENLRRIRGTVGESLALGYLKPGMADPDASYEIEIIGERRPARLAPAPLVDPAGTRMRS